MDPPELSGGAEISKTRGVSGFVSKETPLAFQTTADFDIESKAIKYGSAIMENAEPAGIAKLESAMTLLPISESVL